MLQLSFNPFPELRTQRLLLRAITPDDTERIYQLRTDPSTMRFLDRAPLASKAEAALLIKRIADSALLNDGITWGICLLENKAEIIGTIGFWRIDKEHHRAEIGYMLLPAFFRNGYMTEAMKAVLHFGFNTLKLHSIEANINPANTASEVLLQHHGFIKEAHFKENYYFNGKFNDSIIYSLVNARQD